METVKQLKGAVIDLQRRRAALQQEMVAFDTLQREIVVLRQRSHTDGDARRKLERLDALMKNGGQYLVDQLVSQASQAERCMKKIGDEFQQLTPPADGLARKPRPNPRIGRTFV